MGEPAVKSSFQNAREAFQLELISVGWVAAEAALSAVAAYSVGSISLSAFSMDSGIELVSGMVLVLRLWVQMHAGATELTLKVERAASLVTGSCLFALSAYIAFESGMALARHAPPAVSFLGLVVAVASSVITPWLAMKKRIYGIRLGSRALLSDAACSIVCAYMAWTLLLGLVCTYFFGFWFADAIAACGILYFVLREALESLSSALGKGTTNHLHHH
jgi:divalent metal cation (Fe/Co/Zn/Cd) transporter